jgi:hypothetical protein
MKCIIIVIKFQFFFPCMHSCFMRAPANALGSSIPCIALQRAEINAIMMRLSEHLAEGSAALNNKRGKVNLGAAHLAFSPLPSALM